LGIAGACWLAVKLGIADLPASVRWGQLAGAGVLAGVGFTMSLFIAALAFDRDLALAAAKTSVLAASLIAGLAGYLILFLFQDRK
jgi:NhaA family Na+:H+ antiporter